MKLYKNVYNMRQYYSYLLISGRRH